MKKVLSVFVLVFSCIGIYAQNQETVEGIVYQLNTSKFTATVARGGDSSGDIVIPESITSSYYGVKFSVTAIEALAFQGNKDITSITIPNTVTDIGAYAFQDCTSLTSATIPSSVKRIGYMAFQGCRGFNRINITDLAAWCNIQFGGDSDSNPLSFAHHLYLNKKEIRDLVIPSSVTSIGEYAFYGCSGLASVTIPNSATTIGGSAFEYCI